jgi:hypothetical protein
MFDVEVKDINGVRVLLYTIYGMLYTTIPIYICGIFHFLFDTARVVFYWFICYYICGSISILIY